MSLYILNKIMKKRTGNNQFKKITINNVVDIASNQGLHLLFEQNYKNNRTKMDFEDNDGYRFSLSYLSLVKNDGKYFMFGNNPYSLYNLKKFIKDNNLGIEVLYAKVGFTSRDKIICTCTCGNIREIAVYKILAKEIGCSKCKGQRIAASKTTPTQEICDEFNKFGYCVIGKPPNGKLDEVDIEDDCGYRYKKSIHSIEEQKCKPYKYYKTNPWTIYNLKHYIEINDISSKYISGNFDNHKSIIEFECNCGKRYKTTFASFMYNHMDRCPSCKNVLSTRELKVLKYLDKLDCDYITQYIFDDCKYKQGLPFDFAIFKNKSLFCLIEVQGEQHYKPISFGGRNDIRKDIETIKRFKEGKERDKIKREYCVNHNINLIELKYDIIDTGEYKEILNRLGLAN